MPPIIQHSLTFLITYINPMAPLPPSTLTGQPEEDLHKVRILVEVYLASQGV